MIIKTKDFILRPIRLSDAEGYFECRKNNFKDGKYLDDMVWAKIK